MAAARHAVPAALSQFSSKTAGYGDGFAVTGGMRMMALCSPGTSRPFRTVGLFGRNAGQRLSVQRFIAALIVGAPNTRTHTTSIRYGDHAANSSRAGWRRTAAVIGVSPSRRTMRAGCQTFRRSTITPMHVSELAMSVNSGPQKFDT